MLDTVLVSEFGVILLSAGALVGVVVSLVACAWCLSKKFGFQEFNENANDSHSDQPDSDYNVFTPQGTNRQVSGDTINFDPLPDPSKLLRGDVGGNLATLRPRIAPLNKERLGIEALFKSFNFEFSRTQLQFVREVGSGWFGKVLQGEAQKITVGLRKTKVVVKMLEVDASDKDKVDFLLDNSPYRELEHANIVHLLGQCTQMPPFLMIIEYFPLGDVKSYLLKRQNEENNMSDRRTLVKFACDMAAGLHCLHVHHFVHNDFALRNCMVAMDMTIKVGDYGIAEDLYKDDYYGDEDYPIPIRWSAPETVRVSDDRVVVCNMTKEANVWSFGVTLWELSSLGAQPYPGLTDQDVIKKVIVDKETKPSIPATSIKDKERMHEIMLLCMGEPSDRPTIEEAHKLLQHLLDSPQTCDEFDEKWNKLLPKRDSNVDFPVKFDDDILEGGDKPASDLQGSRLSFTQGFEIENKAGYAIDEDSSNKMIINPSFEEENDGSGLGDEDATPVVSHVVPMNFAEVTLTEDNVNSKIEEASHTERPGDSVSIPMSDDQEQRRGSFRNSVHMMVSESPSEDHVDVEVHDDRDFEASRAESFITVETSISGSPLRTESLSSDFGTPTGSIDIDSAGLREVDRSEDVVIEPPRARVSSDVECNRGNDKLSPEVSIGLEQSPSSATDRISQMLSGIKPPEYSPDKSPHASQHFEFDDDSDNKDDSDTNVTTDTGDVVLRRKHGTASNPLKRSGAIESDLDVNAGFTNLNLNIDANAHVHNKDTEDLDGEEATDSKESILTGTDGKKYRRRSSIKAPDQLALAPSGNKTVSFTDHDSLVQVHTYPQEGSSSASDQEGNRNAVILDLDEPTPTDNGHTDTNLEDAKPNDLDDDMAKLIL